MLPNGGIIYQEMPPFGGIEKFDKYFDFFVRILFLQKENKGHNLECIKIEKEYIRW